MPSPKIPAKTKKNNKPAHAKKPAAPVQRSRPRRLKSARYTSFKLSKRIRHPMKLPSVWKLTRQTAKLLWRHKRLFVGITLIYAVFNLIFVQGLSGSTDLTSLKASLQEVFGGGSAISASLTIFAVLLTSSSSGQADTTGGYQLFLILIVSLAVIWALRETLAGVRVRVRDAYYRGMYPLVPFILVLAVIGLQTIPLAVGGSLYSIVVSNGIAVYAAEKFLWALLFGLCALLSIYMISSSVFALYIVTLPDMTPMRALRTARELVRHRRWTVLRKVLVLPFLLLVMAAAIMLPVILLVTPAAQWVFYLLTMFATVVVHVYLYSLYRELLHD
ncbi:MAG: hypothetical protein ABIV43_03420 [Candidatus Saccharimonadales bacterium]